MSCSTMKKLLSALLTKHEQQGEQKKKTPRSTKTIHEEPVDRLHHVAAQDTILSRNRVRRDEQTERVLAENASFVPIRHATNTIHPREHGLIGTDATTRPRPHPPARPRTLHETNHLRVEKNVTSIVAQRFLNNGKNQQRIRAPNMREECVPFSIL